MPWVPAQFGLTMSTANQKSPTFLTAAVRVMDLSIAQMLFTLGGAVVLPRDLADERSAEAAAQQFAGQMQGA